MYIKPKNIFLFLSTLLGLLAYEVHIYERYYFYFSILFFFLIFVSLTIRKGKIQVNTKIYRHSFLIILLLVISLCFSGFVQLFLLKISFIGLMKIVAAIISLLFIYFFINEHDIKKILFNIYIINVFFSIVNILISFLDRFLVWEKIYSRSSSIFFDPNYYSLSTGISIYYLLFLHPSKKIKDYIFLMLLVISLNFTFSKSGIISLTIAILSSLILKSLFYKSKFLLKTLIFTSIPFILFTSYILLLNQPLYRLDMGSSGRFEVWKSALEWSLENPYNVYFGIGLENLPELITSISTTPLKSFHNYFIDYFIGYGGGYIFIVLITIMISFIGWVKESNTMFGYLVYMFLFSNSIVISLGGLGIFSFLYSSLIILGIKKIEKRKTARNDIIQNSVMV